MAETWSSSRQIVISTADSYLYESVVDVSYHSAKRTYIERRAVTECYLPTFDSRFALCYGEDPIANDLPVVCKSFFRGVSDRGCVIEGNNSAIQGTCSGVNDDGPLILQYPKYFNAPTMPPNFDVAFKVWSEYELDVSSLLIAVQRESVTTTYTSDGVSITPITINMWDIQLNPLLDTEVGAIVNVYVAVSDILGRQVRKDW